MPHVEGSFLETAREPFVIHAAQASRDAHVLFDRARFLNRDMSIMYLLVAVGME